MLNNSQRLLVFWDQSSYTFLRNVWVLLCKLGSELWIACLGWVVGFVAKQELSHINKILLGWILTCSAQSKLRIHDMIYNVSFKLRDNSVVNMIWWLWIGEKVDMNVTDSKGIVCFLLCALEATGSRVKSPWSATEHCYKPIFFNQRYSNIGSLLGDYVISIFLILLWLNIHIQYQRLCIRKSRIGTYYVHRCNGQQLNNSILKCTVNSLFLNYEIFC